MTVLGSIGTIRHSHRILRPDPSRVLSRPLRLEALRELKIVARVLSLSEEETKACLANVLSDFEERHQKARAFYLEQFEVARTNLLTDKKLSDESKLLIGAYFTQEYSLESAALFNPSLVPHWDQSDLTPGSLRFIISLRAIGIANKGIALFPRKVHGRYAMLCWQDNENIYLMFSDSLNFWYGSELLLRPTYPWQCVQLGNCGSPIETDAGWLVLSHAVGPSRKYSSGAFLLDRDDPGKVLGRLRDPLLTPNKGKREGYVPNVVYSCGALVQNGRDILVLPYAMSDYASTFATIQVRELLEALT